MKLTEKILDKKGCCDTVKQYLIANGYIGLDGIAAIKKLMVEKKYDYANEGIVRMMSRKQYIAYAIFAAEQVIDIYEKQYPEDKRPRQAIEAAKAVLKHNNANTRDAAQAAAWGARDAAGAAAWAAAWGAGDAAQVAAGTAGTARDAAWAAAWGARAARDAAWAAAGAAAQEKMQITILNYGLSLLGVK